MINELFSRAIKMAYVAEGKYSYIIYAFLLIYFVINIVLSGLEIVIFGHRFVNYFDYFVLFLWSFYLIFSLYGCYFYNKNK